MVRRYTQLCPVAFGAGSVSTTGDVAQELGLKKVLIVTDENVKKMGHAQKAIDSLAAAGIETFLFGEQIIGCTNYVANEGLRFLCPVPATEEIITESLAKIYDGYQ